MGIIFTFYPLIFFLLSPCNTKQWLAYYSLINPVLEPYHAHCEKHLRR